MSAIAADVLRSSGEVADIRVVVEEFGRLLDVLGNQLGAAVDESHRDCLAVGEALQELVAAKNHIGAIVYLEPDQSVVRRHCASIDESLDAAVVALQFHDRLAQRVGHIRTSLDHLQGVLRDGAPRSFDEWLVLLRDVEQAQARQQRQLAPAASLERPDVDVELF